MPTDSSDPQTLEIDAGLDLGGARATHAELCAQLSAIDPHRPVRLELGAGRPTAAALQLVQATRLALRARGVTAALGPNALTALGEPLTDG